MLRSAESISPLGKKFPSFEVRGDQRTHSLARSFVVNLSLFEMKAEIFQNLNKTMANIYLPRNHLFWIDVMHTVYYTDGI